MALQESVPEWIARVRREGREEGREEGLGKGELIGKIVTLRELLEQTPASNEGLRELSMEELERMLRDLKARLSP